MSRPPVRVLLAEDSATARELLVAILERDPGVQVVGQARNGIEALRLAKELRPDLITMDVHMPLLDGLAATKEIMVEVPTPIIIVSSSTSGRDVDLSLEALKAGALMVLPKPDDPGAPTFNGRQEHFLSMVKAMADVKVVRRWARASRATERAVPKPPAQRTAKTQLVAIAASTGGPAALQRILSDLPGDFTPPLLVVQHIASGFTAGLADWLATATPLRVKVAEHGEPLAPGTAFLAPDDRHLGLAPGRRIAVLEAPPVRGFRPSASFLFKSAARVIGSGVAAVILTGMGSDGVEGLLAVRAAGGHVIAQDEATSVVYGMPRVAAEAGVVDCVLSVGEIANYLVALGSPGRGGTDRRGNGGEEGP